MAKPVITFRNTKGAALTYTELDNNFQNLRDATISFTDGDNTLVVDLNDVITFNDHPEHNLRITVSEETGTIEVDNELGMYTLEPMGFENRTHSTVSFNTSTRVFTIQPRSPTPEYRVWCHGEMYTKTGSDTVTLPNVSDLYYIYFDSNAVLQYKTSTYDFSTDTMVALLQWNAAAGDYYLLGEERHGITMDWATHEYLNATRGMQYASGLTASNYTTSGNGSANSHAQIDLADGVLYQEDIKIAVTHASLPVYENFEQDLQGPGRFPVAYHSNATGQWVKDSATDFPVKQGTARIKYNLNTAGTWTTPDAGNGEFVAYWLVATPNIKDGPIISIMGQRTDNNIGNAQSNNTWASLDLTNFPGREVRPLYRMIFQTGTGYGNTVNARLVDLTDYRNTAVVGEGSTVTGSSPAFQNVVVGGTTVTADSAAGTLTLTSSGSITITANASTDTINISSSASGTVNAGTAGFFAYYPNSAEVVDDIGSLRYNSSSGYLELYSDLNLRGKTIRDSTGNPRINDDLYFTTNTTGPVGSGTLIMRNTASYNTKITLDSSNVYLEGALKVSAITGTPGNTSTPTGYLEVVIGTTTRYIPYYT